MIQRHDKMTNLVFFSVIHYLRHTWTGNLKIQVYMKFIIDFNKQLNDILNAIESRKPTAC